KRTFLTRTLNEGFPSVAIPVKLELSENFFKSSKVSGVLKSSEGLYSESGASSAIGASIISSSIFSSIFSSLNSAGDSKDDSKEESAKGSISEVFSVSSENNGESSDWISSEVSVFQSGVASSSVENDVVKSSVVVSKLPDS